MSGSEGTLSSEQAPTDEGAPGAVGATPEDGEGTTSASAASAYLVGVGASAGGLEALQRLFTRMQRTGAFSFVVVQHLSPDFKSVMRELLAPHTELTVKMAEHGAAVEPDTIYLLPAACEMVVSGGRLLLTERDPSKGLFLPVDVFLRSLGEDAGPRAVAIILSGTGSDGARGLRAVHEAGGLVMAQSEESAKFDGMPRNAVDTGVVDLVLDPEGMADALLRYLHHGARLRLTEEGGGGEVDALTRIFSVLQSECGVDFAEYKGSTVARRIERRLLLSETADLDQYLERLGKDPAELRSLYRDLLIGVTRFFRDPEAFQRLRLEVLPELVRRLPMHEELRVWVAGTATGEEPYSVAMLAAETFRSLGRRPAFRVFATDVHRPSLELAGAGCYGAESVALVPQDLRERYFEPRPDGGLRIITTLRERVVFAHHNILKDAPFTRLDLLTCRNLLIYLNPSAQRRALSLFHFALKAGGIMVLGPSESPGPLSEEFAAIDTRWKIYRKFRDLRLPGDVRVGGTVSVSDAQRGWLRQSGEDARLSRGREALLKRYAPPAVLVDGSLRVLHTFGGAAELFTHRDGPPTVNLLELLDGELRYASSSALKRAQKERAAVTLAGINAPTRDGERRVRVVVEPIESSPRQDESWLVTFEAELAAGDLPRAVEAGAAAGDEHDRPRIEDLLRDRVATLENELRAARHNLQATLEEMETSNEELQATNEELIASNEELQSTNEELHSVNEELYTVNAEYQQKINELTELHADLNNLLEGTAVHTLFLDGELKIRKFTPRIAETFNLLPQDTGRRFDTFAHSLHDERLVDDIRQVLGDGHTVEREVASGTGAEYFLRIMPYRGRAEMPGVVITLIDISALKRAQRELTLSEERYRTLLRSITAAFFNTDVDGRFGVQQDEWQAFTGQPWEEHRGHGWLAAFHPEDRERVRAERDEARAAGQAFEVEARLYSQSDQRYRWTTVRMAPLVGEGERPREWAGYVVDIHERRAAAAELRKKNEQIKAIVDYSPAFIWLKDPSGRYLMAGRQCDSLLGVSPEAIVGKTDFDLMPVGEADRARACERRALETGEPVESEDTYTIDGEQRTSLTLRFPLRDDHGTVYAVAGIASDITERKRTVEEAREAVLRRDRFLAMLSHELRTPLGAILNASNLLARQLDGHATGSGLDIIRRQARHMARLIDDLLDIGRITRDELVIERLPVDLGQAVREVVESSRPVFEDAGVALHVRLPEQPLCVRGDGVRLRQILANLLSNAVNYTPRGGKVWVDGEAAGGRALVTVKDTGVGMSLEELGRVFELFYQAPQPLDRPRGGLGIGLTLAQRLARVHGGELDASSEGRGCGSTFQVVIPLLDSDAAREASATPAAPSRKLRIAIVEDNNDIRETLRDLLALDGHEVLTADDGKDGMDLILRERPDLALVDVGLPRVDGYEVARRTKAACGNATRVVALTGYGRQEDRLKAIEAGFDEHFVKPVEVEALSRLLADVERRKRPEA